MLANVTENNGLKLLGVIDNYSSLIWTESFKSTGDFSLEVPLLKTTFEILKVGRQIYLDKDLSHRMIIEKAQTKVSLDKGLILIASGRCAKSLLSRRIIWDEIRKENLNLLQAIDLVISQNMRGLPIMFDKSKHAFLEKYKTDGTIKSASILDWLEGSLKEFNLGYSLSFVNGNYLLEIKEPRNTNVFFSFERGNMISNDYYDDISKYSNVALIRGEDRENAPRVTQSVGDKTGWDRFETYIDGSSYSSEIAGNKLSEQQYKNMLKTYATRGLKDIKRQYDVEVDSGLDNQFDKYYSLGDIAHVKSFDGNDVQVLVSSTTLSDSVDGRTILPTMEVVDNGI